MHIIVITIIVIIIAIILGCAYLPIQGAGVSQEWFWGTREYDIPTIPKSHSCS